MANTQSSAALKCMNCGAPIQSGFFCAKCQAGETPSGGGDTWKGSRFTGEAGKRRRRQLLMEDLGRYGKVLLILAVIAGVGFGGWKLFGDRIQSSIHQAEDATKPRDKYDPTKDAAADENDQGQANGSRAFSGNNGATGKGNGQNAGRSSIDIGN